MSIAQKIPDNIKRVSRCVGYALWLDNTDDWLGLTVIMRAWLEPHQRAALAFMALKSLDLEDAVLAAETALANGAGQPIAPLFNHIDEAAFWADLASPDEIEAYCLSCFSAMQRQRQAAFLEYVQGRAVA